MKAKLDAFEQSIEDAAEEFVPVSTIERNRIESVITSANKTKNINIRVTAYDIEKIKRKALDEGIPYQTLIASVNHKYITGKLVDEQSILKSMQLLRQDI